jgi:hypothetical protein
MILASDWEPAWAKEQRLPTFIQPESAEEGDWLLTVKEKEFALGLHL